MSRRDTIIIAVLVNAALLMILFATAMRSDIPEEGAKKGRNTSELKFGDLATAPRTEPKSSDELLNEFVTSPPTLAETKEDSFFAFEEKDFGIASSPAIPVETHSHSAESKPIKSQADGQYVQVTVKKGDFLEKIAKGNNTTIAAIMKANNLSSTQLKVGQVLKIPLNEEKKSERPPVPASVQTNTEYYIVKEGDNPWLIATRNKIKLDELLRLNGLDDQKAKRLRPGDKLRIR